MIWLFYWLRLKLSKNWGAEPIGNTSETHLKLPGGSEQKTKDKNKNRDNEGYFLFFWLILKLIWGAGSMSPCRNPLSALVNNLLEKTTVSQKPICWRFYDSMLFLVWLHLHIYPSIINKFLFIFLFLQTLRKVWIYEILYITLTFYH